MLMYTEFIGKGQTTTGKSKRIMGRLLVFEK